MILTVAGTEASLTRLPLRPCAGIVLFNARAWSGSDAGGRSGLATGQHYVADHIWQPPQGGIDKGERARDTAFRELREETGVTSATLIGELPGWLSYELPDDLLGVALKGRYAGQRLRWFAMRFEGREDEIDIAPKGRSKSEFDDWRWADLGELPKLAVPFKRPVYEAVARQLRAVARANRRPDRPAAIAAARGSLGGSSLQSLEQIDERVGHQPRLVVLGLRASGLGRLELGIDHRGRRDPPARRPFAPAP